jgi:hypothetical protein
LPLLPYRSLGQQADGSLKLKVHTFN